MESSREDAIYNPRESLSTPNLVHATTLDSDNSTWQYTCILPPSTHIVDLDSSPAEDPRVVTRTSAATATMALTTQAPLSAPPALSETNTNGIDELNCLPSVFTNIPPKKENFTSGDFGEFASIWVSQGIGASNPPLPVVDLSNPTVKPIPIEFITLRHADSDRTLSQPASTRLSNSRLLDYINSEMGEVDLQHHQCTPHTLRPHRRRRSTQSSLPPPPSSPLASSISLSPSGAKENVAPGPSGSSASVSVSTSAADANALRPKNKKKFDLSNLDVMGTLAKIH